MCTLATCDVGDCAEAEICQNYSGKKRSTYIKLVGRQFECPPGIECGPGPECTAATCSIAGCADAEVCQPNNKRSNLARDCPPFLHGPECGPPCTATTCDFEECAAAEVCQGYVKRSDDINLLNRNPPICPQDVVGCGPGPVCTDATCGLGNCIESEGCIAKRSAETDIVYPVCDICYVDANGATVCGCTHPSGGVKRREERKVCPEICIVTETGETLCGCEAEAYEKSLQG